MAQLVLGFLEEWTLFVLLCCCIWLSECTTLPTRRHLVRLSAIKLHDFITWRGKCRYAIPALIIRLENVSWNTKRMRGVCVWESRFLLIDSPSFQPLSPNQPWRLHMMFFEYFMRPMEKSVEKYLKKTSKTTSRDSCASRSFVVLFECQTAGVDAIRVSQCKLVSNGLLTYHIRDSFFCFNLNVIFSCLFRCPTNF